MTYSIAQLSKREFQHHLQELLHLGEEGKERLLIEERPEGAILTLTSKSSWFGRIFEWFYKPPTARIQEVGSFLIQFLKTHQSYLGKHYWDLMTLKGRLSPKANVHQEWSDLFKDIHNDAEDYQAKFHANFNRILSKAREKADNKLFYQLALNSRTLKETLALIKDETERRVIKMQEESAHFCKNLQEELKQKELVTKIHLHQLYQEAAKACFTDFVIITKPSLCGDGQGFTNIIIQCTDGEVSYDQHLLGLIPFFKVREFCNQSTPDRIIFDLKNFSKNAMHQVVCHLYGHTFTRQFAETFEFVVLADYLNLSDLVNQQVTLLTGISGCLSNSMDVVSLSHILTFPFFSPIHKEIGKMLLSRADELISSPYIGELSKENMLFILQSTDAKITEYNLYLTLKLWQACRYKKDLVEEEKFFQRALHHINFHTMSQEEHNQIPNKHLP